MASAGPSQDGDLTERLWTLVLELSAQLTSNKKAMDVLRSQVEALQGRAVHEKTGVALRRFNVELSEEAFVTQLERLNAQLVHENTALSYESKQLGALLREYETTLETLMGKFRQLSYAAQQHGLDLSEHYEARLAAMKQERDSHAVREGQVVDEVCARVGGLVRDAMSALEGERGTDELDEATELECLRHENEMLRHLLGLHDEPVDKDVLRVPAAELAVKRHEAPLASVPEGNAPPLDTVDAGVAAESAGAAAV